MTKRTLIIMMLLCAAGCAPPMRFSDRAILWRDTDDRPIPVPAPRDPPYHWMAIRDAAFAPADQVLAIDYVREAVNVNALDETPDSTWWTDRLRVPGQPRPRVLSPEEMARGAFGEAPRPLLPLVITKGKDKGGTLGFVAKDALGRKFAIKVDPPGYVSLNTATEVVVSRLAWAGGWNVPAESIIDLQIGDLIVPEKFKALLARAPMNRDGTIRALASLWIEGTIVGPYTYAGRRADDPNDRVPHEDRRDLRGYGVFSAWVNNVDSTETNTLDSYVGEKGRGHLVHFQQDVGGALGSRAAEPQFYWMGNETYFSPSRMLASFASFGIVRRRWEGDALEARRAHALAVYPEIGWFDDESFDPRGWHAIFDNPAFQRATARDRYWGAKRVLSIGEPELRAAIAEGRYRPAAADQLFEILWKRRDKILRAYLSELPPLDHFRVENGALCWDDLWITAGFADDRSTEYSANGRFIARDAPRCAAVGGGGYRVVALRLKRAGDRHFSREVRVHLIDRRIVGLER